MMYFENSDRFFDYFLTSQTFRDTPLYTVSRWQHDPVQNIAQAVLVNPFTEQSVSATIAQCPQATVAKLKRKAEDVYIQRFGSRFGAFNKPVQQVIASYATWQDFRDIWLVRSKKNIAKASIPLLFDYQNRDDSANINVFITLFITTSEEYYRFVLPDQTTDNCKLLQDETLQIIKEAYA